jgi:membrane-bound lytic murein transglycosylase C
MQIVPNSAGKDVQKLIYKRNRAPSSSMLFKPDINIQHGCAYLHILNYRYLKSIKNKAAREHCCIAAYNTGAGNVARAFTGKTNVNSAAKIINRMSADEVYRHLRKNLKYKEARDYVKRVNDHKSLYT